MRRFRIVFEIAWIMWRSRRDGFHQERVAVLRDSSSLEWKLGLLRAWVATAEWAPRGFVGFFAPGYEVDLPDPAVTGFAGERVGFIESRHEDWQENPDQVASLIHEKAKRLAQDFAVGRVKTSESAFFEREKPK